MDNLPINVGDCFTFSNDEGGTHLHIVVADDHDDPYGHVMMVYITSTKIFDETAILEAGSHPFIVHRSWVKYSNMQIILRSELHGRIKERYEPLNQEVFERVRNGIIKSKRTPRGMKETFQDWNNEMMMRKK